MLVVWCPDWPVTAASAAAAALPQRPVAVVTGTLVVAANALARFEGVRRGMRRREAQGRCPELTVLPDDPDRDARLFEPVAAAVEELAVGVEIVRPGIVAVPARGPAGYFGGEEVAAERIIDQVATRTGAECQVGVADGLFAAVLAARRGLVIAPGATPEFLAPLSIRELHRPAEAQDRAELVDLLRRLGLRTLGAFAEIPERDISARFGADAVQAHRLAAGREERPPARRAPPPELTVTEPLDPPVERVDAAAFVARHLAERLHTVLARHGLACTRLAIHAATPAGEERERVWRCAEPLTPNGIADRVRWQLDGWLRDTRLSAGITKLTLTPVEVIEGTTLQLDLWRGEGRAEADERAARAMVHVQGLLGPESVVTPVLGGGRTPAERVHHVPWGDERVPAATPNAPWPGRVPPPTPATVPPVPLPATLTDPGGRPVSVTARAELTAPPAHLSWNGRRRPVVAWSTPWPADERWWTEPIHRTRLQLVVAESEKDSQTALLLTLTGEKWTVEGMYD
ncbi:DNA polymerase Y family protein [Actinophytocola sp. S1-96]|uniref:DNA polymerase Y family protein n=2 Tax=Actinophytocola gossypii TaxID=2812003 RepID=A0ABT2JEX8_9PSEU|nr:DNA polymerase Y family protein [Actinophytocola gossypii]